MTVAQTKAKRHFWSKIDKRYRRARDTEASKRHEAKKITAEKERQSRVVKKPKRNM